MHPSYIDNSPNSVCEAQMCGVPVIATNVGGVCSIVEDGVTGYLVPANDPYQIAYLANNLFKNLVEVEKITETARQNAQQRHNKVKIANQLLTAYNHILTLKLK